MIATIATGDVPWYSGNEYQGVQHADREYV